MGVRKLVVWLTIVTTISLPFASLERARAVDTSITNYVNGQYYNLLATNAEFLDTGSMSVGQIQSFLQDKGSCLATANPSTLGTGANGRSAAQIIWDASQANYDAAKGTSSNYGVSITIDESTKTVSPRVLLITLQKEQSLITTGGTCDSNRLRVAMGYGCPDGGGCDDTYYGFSNQVGWGAWQLRLVYERSIRSAGPYIAGQVISVTDYKLNNSGTCAYANPLETISTPVYLSNHSTASLYSYTPHRYCGNYNFWSLGISWFGFAGQTSDTPTNINDTSSGSARMYQGKFKISTIKSSNSQVWYNGSLIEGTGSSTWTYEFQPEVGNKEYRFDYRTDGSVVGTKVITIERHKNGDINGDNSVNILDLSVIGSAWGRQAQDDDWTNLNPEVDSEINLLDLSIFANSWEG